MNMIDDLVRVFDHHYPQHPNHTARAPGWLLGKGAFQFSLILRKTKKAPHVIMTDVWVSPNRRGKGVATEAMKELCVWFNLYGVTVALTPTAYDRYPRPSTKQLEEWYSRFGFMRNPLTPRSKVMWRLPSEARRSS